MLGHKRDAFAAAALTGLLTSPHFAPGAKRISAIDWEGKTIEEIGKLDVEGLIPNADDLEEYKDVMVTMAFELADKMMEVRG